jgi:hypothetical protein
MHVAGPHIVKYATHIATTGDKTIASTTETTDFQLTQDSPKSPTAAPTKPPIRACEEDDGKLTLHVKKFHMIAAISAANTAEASTNGDDERCCEVNRVHTNTVERKALALSNNKLLGIG